MDTLCDYGGHIVEALNVNVYGNGTQALVLAHGFGADQTLWHYLIPYLACYFKVVVFDLVFSPNVNPDLYNPKKYSNFNGYVQDLLCLLDQLNVNNTIYLGHSMSAMIGCIAATKRPDLFEHLILLSGSPRWFSLSLSIDSYLFFFDTIIFIRIFLSPGDFTKFNDLLLRSLRKTWEFSFPSYCNN